MVAGTGTKAAEVRLGVAECAVQASGLVKDFGPVRAVNGLDLCVAEGETYGLLGPNGSGKTTFIRMVAGLIKPTAGQLSVLGFRMPQEYRKVLPISGYMPQLQALYTDLTVWENVQFYANIFGMTDKKARDERVAEVLELVELGSRRNSLVSTISGGMRQRVSLACALVHRPRLLLLDEPTVGVDPQLRQTFWGYFRTLNSQGVTIIVSSHVMDEADRCDRLGLVRNGHLLASGTPAEIRQMGEDENLEHAFLKLSARTEGAEETNQ